MSEDDFEAVYEQTNRGHGRIEHRRIYTSTVVNLDVDFPYCAQVFRIERTRTDLRGQNYEHEIAYGVTSLPSAKADPRRLLQLSRGHWHIENSLHWVRDVTFDEDRSQIHKGSGPRVMASLRNLAISIFRMKGFSNIARALRYFSWDPARAIGLVGL